MIRFYRLLNYECSELLRGVLLLSAALILSNVFFFMLELRQPGFQYQRFEHLYTSSGGPLLFLLFVILLIAFYVKSMYASYWGSKSIYTFLTLPVKRDSLYWSKLLAFLIGFLVLYASQFISVAITYWMLENKLLGTIAETYLMHNGLYLAYIRSGFFSMLMPHSLSGALSTLLLILTLLLGVYYAVLCERSRMIWGYIPIVVSIRMISQIVLYRTSLPLDYLWSFNVDIRSVILLVICLFFAWHSVVLLRRGAVA